MSFLTVNSVETVNKYVVLPYKKPKTILERRIMKGKYSDSEKQKRKLHLN